MQDNSLFGRRPLAAFIAICGKLPFTQDELGEMLRKNIIVPSDMMTASVESSTPELQVLMVKYNPSNYWRYVPEVMSNRPGFIVPDEVIEYIFSEPGRRNLTHYCQYLTYVLLRPEFNAMFKESQRRKLIKQCCALLNDERQGIIGESDSGERLLRDLALNAPAFKISKVISLRNVIKELPDRLIRLSDPEQKLPNDIIDRSEEILTPDIVVAALKKITSRGTENVLKAFIGIANNQDIMPTMTTDMVDSVAEAGKDMSCPSALIYKFLVAANLSDPAYFSYIIKLFGLEHVDAKYVDALYDEIRAQHISLQNVLNLLARSSDDADMNHFSELHNACEQVYSLLRERITSNPTAELHDIYNVPKIAEKMGAFEPEFINKMFEIGAIDIRELSYIYSAHPEIVNDELILHIVNDNARNSIAILGAVSGGGIHSMFEDKLNEILGSGKALALDILEPLFAESDVSTRGKLALYLLRLKDNYPSYDIPVEITNEYMDSFRYVISNSRTNGKRWKEYLGIGIDYRSGVFTNVVDGVEYDTVVFPSLHIEWMAEDLHSHSRATKTHYIQTRSGTTILYPYDELETCIPKGWRLPTANDFMTLENILGKHGGARAMCAVNFDGTDVCGLHIAPTGMYHAKTGEVINRSEAYYWTLQDDFDPDLEINTTCVKITPESIKEGTSFTENMLAVRCVRDI